MARFEGRISSSKGFYIGDICYVLGEDVYNVVFGGDDFEDGTHTVVGCRVDGEIYYVSSDVADNVFGDTEIISRASFAAASTSAGDGDYEDGAGHEYAVDSGMIGIVPAELIANDTVCGYYAECSGEAFFAAEDGVFDITLPSGETIHIDTRRAVDE